MCEESGASYITVHGRTRAQGYSGVADWNIIKQVKESVNIPVIGNGDITTVYDAKKMIEETNVDGVMVGRGALGNPWIFENAVRLFEGGDERVPSQNEIIDTALYHLDLMIESKGERAGIAESRKHLGWYMKGIRGASELRNRINCAQTLDEIRELLCALKNEQ